VAVYKAQIIDERSPGYLVMASNYVHLNPVRGGVLRRTDLLQRYRWSSYPVYLGEGVRPQKLGLHAFVYRKSELSFHLARECR
jgi:hypothetical protein